MTTEPNSNLSPSRAELLARVAWMYYEEELTQAEIGERLGLNRITVNRMLKEARETGIVEIKIHSSLTSLLPLVSRLCDAYALRNAFITQPAPDGEELYQALARMAAGVLEQHLAQGVTVGIGIGRTLSYMPDYLHPAQPVGCRFISLTGGVASEPVLSTHNFDVVNRLARLAGGQSLYIPAPGYVSDPATRESIVNEPAIRQGLEIARSCQVAVYSVGETGVTGLLHQSGLLPESDMEKLEKNHAAGDVLGHFFDQEGKEIDTDINHRNIGLTVEELMRIPIKILVAGGMKKRQALKVAVSHHFCDILVTDADSAAYLLT